MKQQLPITHRNHFVKLIIREELEFWFDIHAVFEVVHELHFLDARDDYAVTVLGLYKLEGAARQRRASNGRVRVRLRCQVLKTRYVDGARFGI